MLTVGMRDRVGAGIDGAGPVTEVSGSFADEAQPASEAANKHQSQR